MVEPRPDAASEAGAPGPVAVPTPRPSAETPEHPERAENAEPAGPEDHDLIRLAQAGDEAGFEELVRRHQRRAWRVARNMVPSDEDAHDLAQEAFLRVFRSLERFDFAHDFTTWLYRIVTNLAIDLLRKRRPAVRMAAGSPDDDGEVDLDLPDEDGQAPSHELETAETVVAVRDCIASLAPHFSVVLTLRELEGLPCTEISEIVGTSHVTVRWRLHRGRKLFQEEWERRERLRERSLDSTDPNAPPGPPGGPSGPSGATGANDSAPPSVQASDEATESR